MEKNLVHNYFRSSKLERMKYILDCLPISCGRSVPRGVHVTEVELDVQRHVAN